MRAGVSEITQLVQQVRGGDASARKKLMEIAYTEIRRIAVAHLRAERPDHTLQPTALVHEVYLKMLGGAALQFADRSHFFALVSQMMRRILVDHARVRAAERRGGQAQRVTWNPGIAIQAAGSDGNVAVLDLDAALDALARERESLAQVVEMHYFGGMTAEQTAEVIGRSADAVRHDLRLARAWLRRELTRKPRPPD